jgi:putative DNA primase/helicase
MIMRVQSASARAEQQTLSAEDIARALNGRQVGDGWVAHCPAHDDRTPSLSITEREGRPLVHCHAGCSQTDVINALDGRGLWPHHRDTAPSAGSAKHTAAALRIWQKAEPAQSTPVQAYLGARGIELVTIPGALRFHPDLPHPTGQTFPAMVAAVQDVAGAVLAVHRTYLRADGAGKADVNPTKMMLGTVRGGAVRLTEAGETLAIGEGIETALSVWVATELPTWAALSAPGIASLKLPPLPLAAEVIIGTDADDDGASIKAAHTAAARWQAEGRRVRIATSLAGTDFNDVLHGHGPMRVRELIEAASEFNSGSPRVLNLAEFLSVEFPPRENIMDPVFPRQGLGLIHSWRGLGKTYFALSFGLASAAAARFLRWHALRAWKVLYVDGEMRGSDMQTRLAALVKVMEPRPDPGAFSVISPDLQPHGIPDLGTDAGQRWLDAVIDDRDLIILDNLSSLVRSSDSEDEPWLPLLTWLLRLRAGGRSAVLVHHDGKNETQRGISKREDQLDTVFHLRKAHDSKPTDGARFLIDFGKHRGFYGTDAEPFEAALIEAEAGGLTWAMTAVEDAVTMQVAELLNDGCTVSEIAKELKIGRATVDRHKKKATERGLLR